MSIRWLDAFVVLLFGVDNFKSKFLVELNGAIVVYLHVTVSSKQVIELGYLELVLV